MHNAHCILIMHVIVCLENAYKFRMAFGYIIILGQFVDINDVSLLTFNFIGCKPQVQKLKFHCYFCCVVAVLAVNLMMKSIKIK